MTLKYDIDKFGRLTDKITEESIKFFQSIGSNSKSFQEVEKDEIIKNWVEEKMKLINNKAISRPQEIKKWCFVERDFTIDTGELTPTMKLKRKTAYKNYENKIDSLYLDAKL